MLHKEGYLILLIRDMVVERWNRRFGCETTKVYFNDSVENVLRDNMSMIIFDLRGCGGCYRQSTVSVHPSAPVLPTKDSPRNFYQL